MVEPWGDEFIGLYENIKAKTLIDIYECWNLYAFSRSVKALRGDFAEVGVYRGGSARLLSENCSTTLHLFDTFMGIPKTADSVMDLHLPGDFSDVLLSDVEELLKGMPVEFHQGFFPDTSEPLREKQFSFVHIDCDIYRSATDCCEFFFPRLVPGGIMIFDDYNMSSCPGIKIAVNEYFSDKLDEVIPLLGVQCIIFKRDKS